MYLVLFNIWSLDGNKAGKIIQSALVPKVTFTESFPFSKLVSGGFTLVFEGFRKGNEDKTLQSPCLCTTMHNSII